LFSIGAVRINLLTKYIISFTLLFGTLLWYVMFNLFQDEKQELIDQANQQFQAIFKTVQTVGTEALSVGDSDKLAVQSIIQGIFAQKIQGLERIFFVTKSKMYYYYLDKNGHEYMEQIVDEALWQSLKKNVGKKVQHGSSIVLTSSITYDVPGKSIFLGYVCLGFSLDHIIQKIQAKQRTTLIFGVLALSVALVVISLITKLLNRRIQSLHRGIQELAEEKFQELPVKGNDEIADLTKAYNNMIVSVRERIQMARYVSESTIAHIKSSQNEPIFSKGKNEELCLFFSDVREFTSFAENNKPEYVVGLLNQLLNLQVEIIKANRGDIDKFVGDEIMAVFRGTYKEDRAIKSAIEIQKKINDYIKSDQEFKSLRIGIGIHTGTVVAGNIGAQNRRDFTAIGDAVNTAARMCAAAEAEEILISEIVKNNLLQQECNLSEPFAIAMKNKQKSIPLYRVLYK